MMPNVVEAYRKGAEGLRVQRHQNGFMITVDIDSKMPLRLQLEYRCSLLTAVVLLAIEYYGLLQSSTASGVYQARSVAEVFAQIGAADDAAHDFGVARLGQIGDERISSAAAACPFGGNLAAQLSPQGFVPVKPGARMQKQTIALPLIAWGMPMAAASLTAGWATNTDSTSAGPIRLPAILIVSSERPRMYHIPSSSMAAQSPCAQTPGNSTSRFPDSVADPPESAGHADPRRANDQFADLIADGIPCGIDHVSSHAGTGAEKAVGFSGRMGLPIRMPPAISVPPE